MGFAELALLVAAIAVLLYEDRRARHPNTPRRR